MTDQEIITKLKKRVVDLSRAFNNVDEERTFLRRQLAAYREAAQAMLDIPFSYEGQNNISFEEAEKLEFHQVQTGTNGPVSSTFTSRY